MENKFKRGDIVYAKSSPKLKLVVRHFASRIYYCQILNIKDAKDLVFYERELEKLQADNKSKCI
jgi:hypothetical protein